MISARFVHTYEILDVALAKKLCHRSPQSFVLLLILILLLLSRVGKSSLIYADKNGIYVKRKMETRLQMTPIAPMNECLRLFYAP